jgi:hypothetical protein
MTLTVKFVIALMTLVAAIIGYEAKVLGLADGASSDPGEPCV